MLVGSQLVVPNGFESLEKGKTYHLLRNHGKSRRVFLVEYTKVTRYSQKARKKRKYYEYQTTLYVLPQERFDDACSQGLITPAKEQSTLPPWLSHLEGKDLSKLDHVRGNPKMSNNNRAKDRAAVIKPLLDRIEEVLASDDPDNEVARYARACKPAQNESRFKLWFYTAACFGSECVKLTPAYGNCGRYERKATNESKKVGRRSKSKGSHHGYRATPEMIHNIERGYQMFAKIGVSLKKAYSFVMTKVFECKTKPSSNSGNGRYLVEYFHPKGKAFPSPNQFRYYVYRKFGVEQVQINRWGKTRQRTQKTPSVGKFTEAAKNLLERVEADGFTACEHPRGILGDWTMPKLYVIRGRDVLSGKIVGIGFALGSETEAAYRMMLFSMAIDKATFCRLFGVPFRKGTWSNEGLPLFYITDRGPGAKRFTVEELKKIIPLHELAPSYEGQSKATVESSHPRGIKIEGAPTYLQSSLNTIKLIRAELRRVMYDNVHINVSGRLTPEMEAKKILPTPQGIWDYMEKRGRTDAYRISFEDAVRFFLTPIDVTLKDDGAWVENQRYDSAALRKTGILNRVKSTGQATIRGYVLDLCIRYIWVEIDDQIIEVAAKLPISDDETQLYLSMIERRMLSEFRKETLSEFDLSRYALQSEYMQETEALLGFMPDAGKRRKGRVRAKTEESRREMRELNRSRSK